MIEKDFSFDLSNKASKELTRESLKIALYSLLKTKKLENIHVSELVKKAGVSRSGFYNNYSSVKEVLLDSINCVIKELLSLFTDDLASNLMKVIKTYKKYQKYLINLYQSGYAYILLELYNKQFKDLKEDMYYYMAWNGLIYNFLSLWVINGMKETDEEIFENIKETANRMANMIISNKVSHN